MAEESDGEHEIDLTHHYDDAAAWASIERWEIRDNDPQTRERELQVKLRKFHPW